jgi:hypothetical protein
MNFGLRKWFSWNMLYQQKRVLIDPKKIEAISKWKRYVNMTEFVVFLD